MLCVRACVCVSVLECSCVVALFLKFAFGCNLEETQADIGALLFSQKMLFFNCENLVFYLAKQQIAWRLRKALRVPLCGSSFSVSLLYHIRVFVLPASLATPFSNMKSHVQLVPLTRTRSLSRSRSLREESQRIWKTRRVIVGLLRIVHWVAAPIAY